jgi:hypothetical protein
LAAIRAQCNEVDLYQTAASTSGENDLHAGTRGLVRLVFGPEAPKCSPILGEPSDT